ncbi:MAG: tetratricopeptide repeat protein (plasmid) [Leptolyngbya sp. BL-A-14]
MGNLGHAYDVLDNSAKAIEYYQQALAIAPATALKFLVSAISSSKTK